MTESGRVRQSWTCPYLVHGAEYQPLGTILCRYRFQSSTAYPLLEIACRRHVPMLLDRSLWLRQLRNIPASTQRHDQLDACDHLFCLN